MCVAGSETSDAPSAQGDRDAVLTRPITVAIYELEKSFSSSTIKNKTPRLWNE